MSQDINNAPPEVPRALASIQVVFRFFLRIVILIVLASLGTQGFAKTFETLLAFAVFYCIFVAAIRREMPFGQVLTHFDEAAAYAILARVASWMS
jgi:hypothetical protein